MIERVLIADDHPLFRDALRRIVQREITGQIIEVSNATSLMEELQLTPTPSAMFLDLVFPGFQGAASIKELRQSFPHTAIIVITMTDDPSIAESIMEAGANGFISKSVSPATMMQKIRKILSGEIIVCLDNPMISETVTNQLDGLTPRHIDVLIRIGKGYTNKEIARELNISPFTVRAHISSLFKVLDVNTRSAASTIAASVGLI